MRKYDAKTSRPVSPVRYLVLQMTALLIGLTMLLAGCSSDETSEEKPTTENQTKSVTQRDSATMAALRDSGTLNVEYIPPDVPFDLNGTPVVVGGVRCVPATQWEDLGASGEMVAHYRYGPLKNETEQAEAAIYFFGAQGADYEKIMDRWIDQISIGDGRDSRQTARQHDREIGGMKAHVLSMDGIYTPATEGFDREDTGVRDYYRVVGVVIEAPGGNVYFKLTGPDYTGRVMIDQFMNMVYRVRRI